MVPEHQKIKENFSDCLYCIDQKTYFAIKPFAYAINGILCDKVGDKVIISRFADKQTGITASIIIEHRILKKNLFLPHTLNL
jgi:cytoplasmic iron level regulating protein YaaA (DUF328/UPF0246 family)